ncbi:hypothetical protein FIBSPDRAFT_925058 [Athelia psychrophila]|uniref:DUF1212-domain-containing protein n=1 Tax=Athelia psychrophila TaxID=1759441 RepID=A0A166VBU0_9AGAM|nr:hypothetical protein FIBSPDRAFT_925058 [Fibularhizoctonia sp. CBS 109695]
MSSRGGASEEQLELEESELPAERVDDFTFRDPVLDRKMFSPMEQEWEIRRRQHNCGYKFDFYRPGWNSQGAITPSKHTGFRLKLDTFLGVGNLGPEPRPQELVVKKYTRSIRERRLFLIKLSYAFLYLSAPSHQVLNQLDCVAQALEIEVEIVHVPTLIMITLSDGKISPNQTRFVRANGRISLTALSQVHNVVREVSHDNLSCTTGTEMLTAIVAAKPIYNTYLRCFFAFLCSSIICGTAFGGSPIDLGVGGLCSAVLTLASLRGKDSVLDSVYDFILSDLPVLIIDYDDLAPDGHPGQTTCTTSAQPSANRGNHDSVPIAVTTTIHRRHASTYLKGLLQGATDSPRLAGSSSRWWAMTFLVPTYLVFSSLNSMHNLRRCKELFVMVLFACISYAVNTLANRYVKRVTFSTTAGALTIALLGNGYSRLFRGSAFTSMVTGVTFLVPSGIANAGGLSQTYVDDVAQYQTGFVLAIHMLQVAIGVTLGLSLGQFIVYTFGSKKKSAHFAF